MWHGANITIFCPGDVYFDKRWDVSFSEGFLKVYRFWSEIKSQCFVDLCLQCLLGASQLSESRFFLRKCFHKTRKNQRPFVPCTKPPCCSCCSCFLIPACGLRSLRSFRCVGHLWPRSRFQASHALLTRDAQGEAKLNTWCTCCWPVAFAGKCICLILFGCLLKVSL